MEILQKVLDVSIPYSIMSSPASAAGSATGAATEPEIPTRVNRQLFRATARIASESIACKLMARRRQRSVIEIEFHRYCFIYLLREYSNWMIRKIS